MPKSMNLSYYRKQNYRTTEFQLLIRNWGLMETSTTSYIQMQQKENCLETIQRETYLKFALFLHSYQHQFPKKTHKRKEEQEPTFEFSSLRSNLTENRNGPPGFHVRETGNAEYMKKGIWLGRRVRLWLGGFLRLQVFENE